MKPKISYKLKFRFRTIFALLFSFFIIFKTYSQNSNNKPKIGLVLSGGGAKGVAHVPLLQVLDSLNIVPDVIVGTSMGSVVGALYATGYSGNEIADMVNTINWDDLLYGKISFNVVNVEEKSEYKKYLIGLDVVDGSAKATSYLLNDQNLRYKLESLTKPVSNIKNFDSLPIPFRSVTTDIVNFKPYVVKEGVLSEAIRASMSIPGIFEPVSYKNTLLVDGGVLNNFPTDVAKQLGADIIIGSDVSGAGKSAEGLVSISEIFSQTSMFGNYKIYPENRKLANILIDHVPYLSFSTSEFEKSSAIYLEGKIAVSKNIKPLINLSKTLKAYQQKKVDIPEYKDDIVFNEISYEGVKNKNLQLVKSRLVLSSNSTYNNNDLKNASKRLMGTNLFRKIRFLTLEQENKNCLVVKVTEKANHQVNGALHYDLYRGIGVIGNYLGRNLFGASSRFIFSIDIAEQPKFMLQAQKNFGENRSWWWRTELMGNRFRQNIFIDGNLADDFREQSLKYNFQLNKNIDAQKSYVSLSFNFNNHDTEPTLESSLNDNIFSLEKFYSSYFGLNLNFNENTFNKVFYPKKGHNLQLRASRSLRHRATAFFSNIENPDVVGANFGFTQFYGNYHKRLNIADRITGVLESSIGFTLEDSGQDNTSFYNLGFPQLFYIGGNLPVQRANSTSFHGLQEDEIISSQFAMIKLGTQFSVFHNMYVTPQINMASIGFSDTNEFINNIFSSNGNWQNSVNTSLLFSLGTMFSYDSILGPVDFNVTYTNGINKIRLFLSVGIPLYR